MIELITNTIALLAAIVSLAASITAYRATKKGDK